MEIAAGLLRHPSPISVDAGEACEDFPYVFEVFQGSRKFWLARGFPFAIAVTPGERTQCAQESVRPFGVP